MASSLRGNARSPLPRLGGILKETSGQMQPNNTTSRDENEEDDGEMMEKWWRERERGEDLGIRETDTFKREGERERDGRGCWRLAVIRRGTKFEGPKTKGSRFRGKEDISMDGMEVASLRELFQALVEFQESMTGKFRSLLSREILILEMNGHEGRD